MMGTKSFLQHATSWTRDNVNNNFLYDAGSELNNTTGMYDLPYRNYDATLGRFFQVDALSHKSHDLNPYHYAANNPIGANDPSGLNVAYVNPLRAEVNDIYQRMDPNNQSNWWDLTMDFFGMSMSWGSNPKGGSNNSTQKTWKDALGNDYEIIVNRDGTFSIRNVKSDAAYVSNIGRVIGMLFASALVPMTEDELKEGAGGSDPGLRLNPWKRIPSVVNRSLLTGNIAWEIDVAGDWTTIAKKGQTVAVNKLDKNTDLTVYIHPSAFDYDDYFLSSVVGHEWIHVAQFRNGSYIQWFNEFGEKGYLGIGEEKAWRWTKDFYPNAIGNNALTPAEQWEKTYKYETPALYNKFSPFYLGYY